MKPKIYMWSSWRSAYLARHDFYMEQVRARVLRNFDNMEEEAEQINNEIAERLASLRSEGGDMAAAAEIARHDGMEFFMFLSHLKTQTTLGGVSLSLSSVGKRLPGLHAASNIRQSSWQGIKRLFLEIRN